VPSLNSRHSPDHFIKVQAWEGEHKAAVSHASPPPIRRTSQTYQPKAKQPPPSKNQAMVGYGGTHHAADMRNSRSFAPLVAGTSSPHLHHLLRTGMRTAMVSSSFNAKHCECPSGNHKCTDIAKSSCCHQSILRKPNQRVPSQHAAHLNQCIRIVPRLNPKRLHKLRRAAPHCRHKPPLFTHSSQRISTTGRLWHPAAIKNLSPIHKR
jgi:hypothetical protein